MARLVWDRTPDTLNTVNVDAIEIRRDATATANGQSDAPGVFNVVEKLYRPDGALAEATSAAALSASEARRLVDALKEAGEAIGRRVVITGADLLSALY